MKFFVSSDLAVFGRTEDGQEYTAPVYFVVAESVDGSRLRHEAAFPSAESGVTDDGLHWFRELVSAKARAERLRNRITSADRPLDLTHWFSIPAAYGSVAHSESDWRG